MRTVYVDSGAFIAVLRPRDAHHERMSAHLRALRATGDRLVTSEAVVAETATRLRNDARLATALGFEALLTEAAEAGILRIRESDPALRRAAFDVLRQYADLPLSYADGVGAAVAREVKAAACSASTTTSGSWASPSNPAADTASMRRRYPAGR